MNEFQLRPVEALSRFRAAKAACERNDGHRITVDTSVDYAQLAAEVRAAWALAAFNGGKENLTHYFTYQVNLLSELLSNENVTPSGTCAGHLIELIRHISTYFPGYIAPGTKAPMMWTRCKITELEGLKNNVFVCLKTAGIDADVFQCLETATLPYFMRKAAGS